MVKLIGDKSDNNPTRSKPMEQENVAVDVSVSQGVRLRQGG